MTHLWSFLSILGQKWVRDLGAGGPWPPNFNMGFVCGTQGAHGYRNGVGSGRVLARVSLGYILEAIGTRASISGHAAPRRWTSPWVASVPKVHTGIGVGPGPAGSASAGGDVSAFSPPPHASRAAPPGRTPYGWDRLDLSFTSVPGWGRVEPPSGQGGRFSGFWHVSKKGPKPG